MYRVVTWFRPLPGETKDFSFAEQFETFEEAQQSGRQYSCLAGTTAVYIYNEIGKEVASCEKLGNFWYDYKKKNGTFCKKQEYFEKLRRRVQQDCFRYGFNVRLKGNPQSMTLIAGEDRLTFPTCVLPWISDICEEIWIREEPLSDYDEPIEPIPDVERFAKLVAQMQERVARGKKKMERTDIRN